MKQNLFIAFISLYLNNYIFGYDFNNIEERLQKYEYLYERYGVTTEDGYVLNHFRILPRNCENDPADVVLLGHGQTSNGATFLSQDPQHSLGFLLADKCCDVYLLNYRGSYYSLGHKYYNTSNSKYWNWTFHEMGIYDLPASIDLAKSISNVRKVTYIGHSEGTNAVLILLARIPSYNNVIKNCFLLAPVAYTCNTRSAISQFIAKLEKKTRLVTFALSDNFNLLSPLSELGNLFKQFGLDDILSKIQFSLDNKINGNDKCKGELVSDIFFYTKSRIATHDFAHFIQFMAECNFKPYQPFLEDTPESYPLKNVKTRIFSFIGINDESTHPKDIALLMKAMPSLEVNLVETNHRGLLACRISKSEVYEPIINIIKKRTVIKKIIEK